MSTPVAPSSIRNDRTSDSTPALAAMYPLTVGPGITAPIEATART
ncbi:hypothetical protein C1Y40_05544 [Mycobacterium talmoniae]|uniref:Uncharacterized protein n=1 Tax=Mycobacterium talmoniae TaxID=1858794 RepID=A0A2S8BCB8_9MYCO|nr:hypothetical protein C1Y40_05544 [Mycobacterium talmoniae]